MNILARTALGFVLGFVGACGAPVSGVSDEDLARSSIEDVVAPTFDEAVMRAGSLSGLHINAGPNSPVLLIIPGSGPTDLDGNNPLGVESNTYKYLAQGLAEKGVSTVRVDKRGMFSSAEAGDPNQVTLEIYADDYSEWVNRIKIETGTECVYVLGHSEGALMASAAANLNTHVCGQILVSGVGRSFGEVLREQLKANPANFIIMKEAVAAIETLEAGNRVATEDMHVALRPLFAEQVQGFMISIMGVDPAQIAADANMKTLIVHGETDIQTSILDAQALATSTGGKLVIVPGVNHILKEAPLNRRKNMKTYSQPDLPISADVVDAIADFIETHHTHE